MFTANPFNQQTLDGAIAAKIAAEADAMMAAVSALSEALEKKVFGSTEEYMQFCANTLRAGMDTVRRCADTLETLLETLVADELWPLPTYQEMLFIK